jgi:hypothetical protein
MNQMMKWIIGFGIFWVIVITGVIVFSQTYNGQKIPVQTSFPELNLKNIDNSGPEVGGEIITEESPKQLVTRYLQYVNANEIDAASGLVDPNKLLEYSSTHKDISPQDALKAFVTIFKEGDANSFTVSNESLQGAQATVVAQVKVKNGSNLQFTFSLHEFQESEHGSNYRFWNIVKIVSK